MIETDSIISQIVLCRYRVRGASWTQWSKHTMHLSPIGDLRISDIGEGVSRQSTVQLRARAVLRHVYAPPETRILCVRCEEGDVEVKWVHSTSPPVFIRDDISSLEKSFQQAIEQGIKQQRQLMKDWAHICRCALLSSSSQGFRGMSSPDHQPLLVQQERAEDEKHSSTLLPRNSPPTTTSGVVEGEELQSDLHSDDHIGGTTMVGGANVIPKLNILILVVGTRGDVMPFIQIATNLIKKGHRVRLATHQYFQDLIQKDNQSINFYPLAGDPEQLAKYMKQLYNETLLQLTMNMSRDLAFYTQLMGEIMDSCWTAYTAPFLSENNNFHAIISNPVTYAHIHIAEKTGLPLHIMFPQPWIRTKAFPHPLVGSDMGNVWSIQNALSYDLVEAGIFFALETQINNFRVKILDLEALQRYQQQGWNLLARCGVPFTGLYSPVFYPAPKDWPDNCTVAGMTSHEPDDPTSTTAADDASPEELSRLVMLAERGSPLIYMGFGSMLIDGDEVAKLLALIDEAIATMPVRVLLQVPASTTQVLQRIARFPFRREAVCVSSLHDLQHAYSSQLVVLTCFAPHELLFQACAAVVHHGGAGTTHLGLRAGRPTFVVPFFADQFSWGHLAHRHGCGPRPVSLRELTAATFKEGLDVLLSSRARRAAETVAAVLSQERGASAAVEAWERHLPVGHMLCQVSLAQGQVRLATHHCRECDLNMSGEVSALLHDHDSGSGPASPASASPQHTVSRVQYADWSSMLRQSSQQRGAEQLMHRVGSVAVGVTKDLTCSLYRPLKLIYDTSRQHVSMETVSALSTLVYNSGDALVRQVHRALLLPPPQDRVLVLDTAVGVGGEQRTSTVPRSATLYTSHINYITDWVCERDCLPPGVARDDAEDMDYFVREEYHSHDGRTSSSVMGGDNGQQQQQREHPAGHVSSMTPSPYEQRVWQAYHLTQHIHSVFKTYSIIASNTGTTGSTSRETVLDAQQFLEFTQFIINSGTNARNISNSHMISTVLDSLSRESSRNFQHIGRRTATGKLYRFVDVLKFLMLSA